MFTPSNYPSRSPMMRHKKAQTPQEIYRARKQREEAEKEAALPPGLINHGNTCFMNSTLQGLMATELLHHLVNFDPLPISLQKDVAARRSPQLTNGHGLGGQHELARVEGMPLGDVFVETLRKGWGIQEGRRRECLSPKDVLLTIGKKYEQYMDFRQQDAHEFLRHMLDAMRMEELDIIKKRQPPPPKEKRKRSRRKPTPLPLSSPPDPSNIIPVALGAVAEEEKLESFVDMLFGGQLASILVCEKCKKVSVTYEDFNDLSLSIKPEDYAKGRKRDKLKLFARKFRFRPGSAGDADAMRNSAHRSSSVPASPIRRSMEAAHHEEVPVQEGPRRKSFDHAGESDAEDEARDEVRELAASSSGERRAPSAVVEDEDEGSGEIGEERGKGKTKVDIPKEKGEKKKQEDPFVKLGRRISMSMKMTRPPGEWRERGRRSSSKDATRVLKPEAEEASRTSLGIPSPTPESSSDVGETSDIAARVSPSPVPSPSSSPSLAAQRPLSDTNIKRPSTPLMSRRTKSPAAPKLSREEAAYFRRILSDVHPSAGNPFSLLHQALTSSAAGIPGPSSASANAQAIWAKIGHLPGIEECLRMFTAVEVLDGENMVGCHRCWKVANGTYKPRRSRVCDAESESEDEAEDAISPDDGEKSPEAAEFPVTADPEEEASTSSPDTSASGRISPLSVSAISTSVTTSSEDLDDGNSVASAPTTLESGAYTSPNGKLPSPTTKPDKPVLSPVVSPSAPSTYGGLPIPSISTTAPESPLSARTPTVGGIALAADKAVGNRSSSPLAVSPSDDSLLTPKISWQHKRKRRSVDGAATEETSESSDEYDSDTDASVSASEISDASPAASPVVSPSVSPRTSLEDLRKSKSTASTSPASTPPKASQDAPTPPKPSRTKQVVPRRMFKRYLIATPPPILVVHLKRFQQVSRTYSVSFSSGFKKLDEFVAFPEYLDITPFIVPRKEDFGLGKAGAQQQNGHVKESQKGMYRLYAVVVHIGNMLGGHYVAYTALPTSAPAADATPSTASSSADSTASRSATPHDKDGSAKARKPARQWAYISDTVVRLTTLEEVLKAKAYICMYERT